MSLKISIAVIGTLALMSSSTYLLTQTHFACNMKEKKCCNVGGKQCCGSKERRNSLKNSAKTDSVYNVHKASFAGEH